MIAMPSVGFLRGFGFSGFRSFSDDIEIFNDLKKVNLLIGLNNCGKSNVLSFLCNYLHPLLKDSDIEMARLDKPYSENDMAHNLRFALPFDGEMARLHERLALQPVAIDPVSFMREQESTSNLVSNLVVDPDQLYFKYSRSTINASGTAAFEWATFGTDYLHPEGTSEYKKQERAFFRYIDEVVPQIKTLTKDKDERLRNCISRLDPRASLRNALPHVSFIPQYRQVKDSEKEDSWSYDGEGLIKRLAALASPEIGKERDRERFLAIQKFLREVIGNNTAEIQIPSTHDMIIVVMDGKRLPLAHLGTGIHQVIILAVAATLMEFQIVCIEEPEIHLHAGLQKALLRYLIKNTTNQYFITTHSTHLLSVDSYDEELVNKIRIFHIRLIDNRSRVESVVSDFHKFSVCQSLGHRASDLMQANCLLWVEGPSDVLYIRHWLNVYTQENRLPPLLENLHYSFAMYGGRNIVHLTAALSEAEAERLILEASIDDEEELLDVDDDQIPPVDEERVRALIEVFPINRCSVLVMDKDLNSTIDQAREELTETFLASGCPVWKTKGREVENYIDQQTMEEALLRLRPNAFAKLANPGDKEKHGYYYLNAKGKEIKSINKVLLAKTVVDIASKNLDVLDLKERLEEIVDYLYRINGLRPDSQVPVKSPP